MFAVAYLVLRRRGVFKTVLVNWPASRIFDFTTAVALGLWYL